MNDMHKNVNNNMLQSSKVCESESVLNKNEYIKKNNLANMPTVFSK